MKRLLLLTIGICIAELSFSQTDFRKGYVITNERDTLFGLIDYREGVKAYNSCDFKKSKDLNTITYEPTAIVGYGFSNDKFFESKKIPAVNQPPKQAFAEVLVKGLVSLYVFEEAYFIEKNGNGLQQLINEAREEFIDGKRVLINTNQHIATINMLLFDCAELKPRIQEIRLNERPLTTLILDYNKCKGFPAATYKAKKPWVRSEIGTTVGANVSQIDFEDNNAGYEYLSGPFEPSKSPTIGISIDVLSPRISERFSFHSDILYLKSKYYNYSVFDNSFSTKRNYVVIELQQLKIPIGIRYTFPKRNYTPYFNVGISTTIHLSTNSEWMQEVESNNIVETLSNEALTIKENQFGLWGGMGLAKSVNRKLVTFLEIRYEQTSGITPFSVYSHDLKSKITNFQILIGIRTK